MAALSSSSNLPLQRSCFSSISCCQRKPPSAKLPSSSFLSTSYSSSSFSNINTCLRAADSSSQRPVVADSTSSSSSSKQRVVTSQSKEQEKDVPLQSVSPQSDGVPVEGVIRFDTPSFLPSNWRDIALVTAGDALALLIFAAIGRQSHGLPPVDLETLHVADHFIAGWLLSAYFLGGFSADALGENGRIKAILSAIKCWALGIPVGLVFRGLQGNHFPATAFILVSLGSTFVLLIGWRSLFAVLARNSKEERDKAEVYKKGSPFELFELLSSLPYQQYNLTYSMEGSHLWRLLYEAETDLLLCPEK